MIDLRGDGAYRLSNFFKNIIPIKFKALGSIYSRMLITVVIPFLIFSFSALYYMLENQNEELSEVKNLLGDLAADQFVKRGFEALYLEDQAMLDEEIEHMRSFVGVDGLIIYNVLTDKIYTFGYVDYDVTQLPTKLPSQSMSDFIARLKPLSHQNYKISSDSQQFIFRQIRIPPGSQYYSSRQDLVGWVMVAMSNNMMMGRRDEKIFLILMVVGFLIFFAGSLSVIYARKISQSIIDLNTRVDDMALGNVDDLAKEVGPNEIQQLARGINRLAITIRDANLLTQSEIARATSQLHATLNELEEVAKGQNQFLARMSHELRTPLTAVIGFSRLVASEESTVKRSEYLDVVEVSSTMLLTMIDDILEFSKAQSAGFTLEKINFDIRKWLVDVMAIHRKSAEDKNLKLHHEINGSLPQLVRGDPVRLAQIISNLVSNAIKFTEEGVVSVNIEMDSSPENFNILHCTVKDCGKGIAIEQQEALFEPFTQENEAINRLYGGAGLGLSICKKLVNIMDGDISLHSIIGQGTDISFNCRLYEPFGERLLQAESDTGSIVSEILTGVKILVAEDNLFSQKLIVKLLEGYGAECSVVNNGLEAIEIVRMLDVDLVLMDVHMPVVDGIEACASIVNQSPDSPPVLGLTADITGDAENNMIEAGAQLVLRKPLNETALINAILSTMERKSQVLEPSQDGLLSSIIPVAELKEALEQNLNDLEEHLDDASDVDFQNVLHNLLGLSGLYGMAEFRQLILSFKASYGIQSTKESKRLLQVIRQNLEENLIVEKSSH
jgi:signal transduction histidine kinase/CheY-like chemotaxis protein